MPYYFLMWNCNESVFIKAQIRNTILSQCSAVLKHKVPTMLTMQLWITLLLILWIYVLWSRRRIYRLMLQIPGPLGYPLLGALPRFWRNSSNHTIFITSSSYKHLSPIIAGGLRVVDEDMMRWGPTYLGWFGPIPVLAVGDPQVAQDLLSSPHTIMKSNIGVEVMAEVLGEGLAIINGTIA